MLTGATAHQVERLSRPPERGRGPRASHVDRRILGVEHRVAVQQALGLLPFAFQLLRACDFDHVPLAVFHPVGRQIEKRRNRRRRVGVTPQFDAELHQHGRTVGIGWCERRERLEIREGFRLVADRDVGNGPVPVRLAKNRAFHLARADDVGEQTDRPGELPVLVCPARSQQIVAHLRAHRGRPNHHNRRDNRDEPPPHAPILVHNHAKLTDCTS